jgi:phage tail-like protein
MADVVVADTGLMSNAFYLEIDGNPMTMLTGVRGLDVGVQATNLQQTTKDGKISWTRTLGTKQTVGTLMLTRLAVTDAGADGVWTWFKDTALKGALQGARKGGSVVMYASDGKELGRYSFTNGWVSKISLEDLDITNGNPLKETITLEIDFLERTK